MLAVQLEADYLLLDDLPARNFARPRGLEVIGTLGVLLEFKSSGAIDEVRQYLNKLLGLRFRMGTTILAEVLRQANESN